MSSHREAPEIAKDPVADSTDVYAFMHPTQDDQVVLIANFIPLQQANGGPNFYEFGDDVLYEINVSNTNKAEADVIYSFNFRTQIRNPNTFLYNFGVIDKIDSPMFNRPQVYDIIRTVKGKTPTYVAQNVPVPPVNVGARSTPNYPALANSAIKTVSGRKFFAGQRADAFHVDLGSIFDLGALRPFNEAHLISMPQMNGVNAVQSYNCHTIAMQVPVSDLTADGKGSSDPLERRNVIGVWATANRARVRVFNKRTKKFMNKGPAVQVSRLGNPLVNEVLIPMSQKDKWNAAEPNQDSDYAAAVNKPELQGLLPFLYPGVFPKLDAFNKGTRPRADLNAILLTGIPEGVVKDGSGKTIFQNYTGPVEADMLRLNMGVPPTAKNSPSFSIYGVVGGDIGGFPNGRRLEDDVVAIELRAVAGATIPLVYPDYVPDDAAGALTDGTTNTNSDLLADFPFLGHPGGGYETVPGTAS